MREQSSNGMADEDAALMLQARDGDQAAFARLYDRNARAVVNFAYRFVQDRARAEELAQEIFLKLFRSAGSYEPRARFKTFLFRIAANHCLNERRRGEYTTERQHTYRHRDEKTPEVVAPGAYNPEEELAGKNLEMELGRALASLPQRERIAFSLARFEGMPYKEIAHALDTSEPAVKSLIHRATVAVAQRLAPVVEGHSLEEDKGLRRHR